MHIHIFTNKYNCKHVFSFYLALMKHRVHSSVRRCFTKNTYYNYNNIHIYIYVASLHTYRTINRNKCPYINSFLYKKIINFIKKKYMHVSIYIQDRSPLILLANCISLGIIVTRLACMAHRLVSSKSPTR